MTPKKKSRAVEAKATQRSEHGGALPFVLIIGASLMFVAAYSLTVGVSTRRAAGSHLQRKSAFFCAERGLQAAKRTLIVNKRDWDAILANPSAAFSTWYPVTNTCLGAGGYSYRVTIRDNLDDAIQTTDIDGAIILDSVAFKAAPFTPMASLSNLIETNMDVIMSGHAQEGGAQNTFNSN
ncbi:MAG: hypothetical protein JRH20_29855 [Deltaproteobacteria bacterium]|nr:hypothetical protein [Deltaproteobacteria bacterium]